MNIKRQLAVALIVGVGSGLVGCKSPMGGLAFWNRDDSSIASSGPDAGREKYAGLAQEFGASPKTPTTGLGGTAPASDEGFVESSWNKTTGAIAAAFAVKPKVETDDPTSLTSKTGKLGPDVHIRAARLLEGQNKMVEAAAHYEKALKLAPNDLTAMVSLARLHDRQNHSAKSIELYQKAIKAHPKTALVHNDLGLCYARQKQWQRATESLSKAIELQPANPKYRNNMATVMVELGRTDDALKQLTAVNSEAVAHFNLAYLLEQKGQNDAAVRHLQLAVSKDPTLAQAHQMLAQLSGQAAPTNAPQPETRVAAQSVSAPVARQTVTQEWLPQQTIEAAEQSKTPPKGPAGKSGSVYHIGDDIGPIQQESAATPSESAAAGDIEPLPPIDG